MDSIPISDFDEHFGDMAERFQIHYHLSLTDYRRKVAILVSAYDHCLADLLYRHAQAKPSVAQVCGMISLGYRTPNEFAELLKSSMMYG